eukprot:TRINITY_DN65227_c0_g1_i1.p2 TRINITY_DN65227_c0_g1~~TRINITY_DN65227_c0_g1_i1.p2  ORF type:complete len:204 (-),score=27.82 TRINITY_DN65227_c0_g1_i1:210-821(-)
MGGVIGAGGYSTNRVPAAFQTLYQPGHSVELAATPIGPRIPGIQAYHTSVVVEGIEYSFSFEGVTYGPDLISHRHLPEAPPKVIYMGLTSIEGKEMYRALKKMFAVNSYDLLRKNCNSFSDCALFYLLDIRLDPAYRDLEQIGDAADRNAGVVQKISGGEYYPNPKAADFDLEKVMRQIDAIKGGHAEDEENPVRGMRNPKCW